MLILISPAKRMREDADFILPRTTPVFLDRAEILKEYCKSLGFAKLKKLLCCNDPIARENDARYQRMELNKNLSPAIFAFDGIQYQYMAPQVFETAHFSYIQRRLRILSGLYGVLKPFDGVVSYRLEMQAKLNAPFAKSLYAFWGDEIFRALLKEEDALEDKNSEDKVLINLASAEYAKCVIPFTDKRIRRVDCIFAEREGGRLVEKGVYVKMARGEMVRYLAEIGARRVEQLTGFNRMGYRFCKEESEENRLVFVREKADIPKK